VLVALKGFAFEGTSCLLGPCLVCSVLPFVLATPAPACRLGWPRDRCSCLSVLRFTPWTCTDRCVFTVRSLLPIGGKLQEAKKEEDNFPLFFIIATARCDLLWKLYDLASYTVVMP
jgi:hypothetical protein